VGKVKCWGYNSYGQLGDGTSTARHKPVGVVGFGGVLKCVVPKVVGDSLANARYRIAGAHCRVGKVIRVASRRRKGTVVAQSPRPGKVLAKGSRVGLTVSRGR
jgi:beta-lactam-binding protein with PASTA domain